MYWSGIDLTSPVVMGILNVTPDSFSDGGDLTDSNIITQRAEEFCRAGAQILDIGGESTRPGAVPPTIADELARVLPAIQLIKPITEKYNVKISIDTRRTAVMEAAVAAGADIINDVSGLSSDADAIAFVVANQLPVVLCHMQGTPQDMQAMPSYTDVVHEVVDYLSVRAQVCIDAGLKAEKICLDPGIGFGKTLEHNIVLLQNLSALAKLGFPVLIGLSRKRMIGELTGVDSPKERLAGSLAGGIYAAQSGAHILRVHDVAETVQALQLWCALTADKSP
jgi:dihydropteroate synthase